MSTRLYYCRPCNYLLRESASSDPPGDCPQCGEPLEGGRRKRASIEKTPWGLLWPILLLAAPPILLGLFNVMLMLWATSAAGPGPTPDLNGIWYASLGLFVLVALATSAFAGWRVATYFSSRPLGSDPDLWTIGGTIVAAALFFIIQAIVGGILALIGMYLGILPALARFP